MSDLDFSKLEQARALVAKGNEIVTVNCSCCQGMSMHDRPGEPGYCPECGGRAYVDKKAWRHWQLEGVVDYWQARTLVAEDELRRLRRTSRR